MSIRILLGGRHGALESEIVYPGDLSANRVTEEDGHRIHTCECSDTERIFDDVCLALQQAYVQLGCRGFGLGKVNDCWSIRIDA